MSTCRGCWHDERTPLRPGMVTLAVNASADPWVSHGDESECPTYTGGQPHKMSQCGMFAPTRLEFLTYAHI